MRKLFYIFYILLLPAFTYAQTWVPVGSGLSPGAYVNTLFVYDSVLYAGGYFFSPGNNIAQWNDTVWSSLGSGINNRVYAFGLYKDTLYVGGDFTEAGGHSAGSIAKWTGTSFANAGFNVEGGQVDAIQAYNGLLYIGGAFSQVNNNKPSGLVSWNGQKTDSVTITNYPGFYWTDVTILTTYNNSLLMGFEITIYGGAVGTWSNYNYTILGNIFFYPATNNGSENAFCQVDTDLYLGGSFLYTKMQNVIDTVNNIAVWNGKKWAGLGKGIHGTVYAIVFYDSLIVAGGSFDSAGGIPVNNIAAWNGTEWSALGNGVNGAVYALAVFNSNLYAGGNFDSPSNGIAEFNPTLKIIPPLINNDSINIFPNPNKGQFTVIFDRAITAGAQPIIEIYNNLGQKIYSANLADGTNLIDMGKPAKGVYIYKITSSGNNLINPGKLVIE